MQFSDIDFFKSWVKKAASFTAAGNHKYKKVNSTKYVAVVSYFVGNPVYLYPAATDHILNFKRCKIWLQSSRKIAALVTCNFNQMQPKVRPRQPSCTSKPRLQRQENYIDPCWMSVSVVGVQGGAVQI